MKQSTLWHNIINFCNSSFFIALVTLGVGLIALLVYRKQKIDNKKTAANIILLEIKNAETHLTQAKNTIVSDGVLPETIYAMGASSWDKYSYLFVGDFTGKEWDILNTFYEKCHLYDEAVEYNNTFFKKNEEQIRVNLHHTLADYIKLYLPQLYATNSIKDHQEKDKKVQEIYEELQEFLTNFANHFMDEVGSVSSSYSYSPKKAFLDGQAVIETIRLDLSTSNIGVKLEKIVNQNFRSRLFDRLIGTKSVSG